MIPYNTPEEQQTHETYLNYLVQWINHCWNAIPASPEMDAELWVRQAYMRNDFESNDLYAMLRENAYAGVPWACCEYYIFVYSQSGDEEARQAFYNVVGEDITNYVCPYV
jgi:hypothetical protein